MRRPLVLAALAAAVLLPAPSAGACSPSIGTLTAPKRAVAGSDVRLAGKAHVNWCPEGPPSTPAPVVGTTSAPVDDGGPLPVVTLPPLRPVSYAAPERAEVRITLAPWNGTDRGPARTIAVVRAHPAEPKATDHAFDATVTIPADVAPGTYVIEAKQANGVWFGNREIAVTSGLPATGSGNAAGLARVALLAILGGAGALAAARRVEPRR